MQAPLDADLHRQNYMPDAQANASRPNDALKGRTVHGSTMPLDRAGEWGRRLIAN